MLKFHRDTVWSFHYRHYVFSCAALVREAWTMQTKMAHMLLWTCKEQQSAVWFLWAKEHNPSEIHRDMCGVTVWTVAMSPGGVHSSRWQFLGECWRHCYVHVNFAWFMPFRLQVRYPLATILNTKSVWIHNEKNSNFFHTYLNTLGWQ